MKNIYLFLFLFLHSILFGQPGWVRKADIPSGGRYNIIGFVLNQMAYVGTGYKGGAYSSELFKYNPANNTWQQIPDFPGGARWSPVAFAVNGKGYICLGFDSFQNCRNDVWEFNPETENWTRKADFPGGGRYGIAAFVIDNKAYLSGGSINQGFNYLNELWCYDPLTDTWTQKTDMPTEHSTGQVSFTLNDTGYIGTGLYDSYTPVADFYKYDPANDVWTTIQALPAISAGCVAFVLGEKPFVGTGTDWNIVRKRFWSYSPDNNDWVSLPDPPDGFSPRYGGFGFSIGDTGYVVGGMSDNHQLLDDLWAFSTCSIPVSGFTYNVNDLVVEFTDSSQGASHYFWDFGDGATSTEKDPVHSYINGTYKVCHAVINNCGSDTTCKMITVSCSEPVSRFFYTINLFDVQFTDSSSSGHLISRFWDFGDSTHSSDPNPNHTYPGAGIYNACLTVIDSCGINMSCQEIDLYLPLALKITITQSQSNDLLTQFMDETIGTTFWTWTFGDGDSSSEQNPSHIYKPYGSYQVCLTAGDQDHRGVRCDNFILSVNPSLHTKTPAIIYPNPSEGKLYLRFYKTYSNTKLQIFDQTGKQTIVQNLPSTDPMNLVSIDLTGLPKGVWFIQVICEDFTRIWKIVLY